MERFDPCGTDECKKRCDSYGVACEDIMADEIERLHAELAECKQDAERYRWLRHPRMGWDIVHKTEVGLVCAEYLACVELDAAIDAARKGEGEQ